MPNLGSSVKEKQPLSDSTTQLTDLPNDVLQKITDFLPLEDTFAFSATCSKLGWLSQDLHLWKKRAELAFSYNVIEFAIATERTYMIFENEQKAEKKMDEEHLGAMLDNMLNLNWKRIFAYCRYLANKGTSPYADTKDFARFIEKRQHAIDTDGQYLKGVCYFINHLDIDLDLKRLIPAITRATNRLTYLKFYKQTLRPEDMKALCEALKHPNCSVRYLAFSSCKITDEMAEMLADALRSHKTLRGLNLHLTALSFLGLHRILSALGDSIEHLALSYKTIELEYERVAGTLCEKTPELNAKMQKQCALVLQTMIKKGGLKELICDDDALFENCPEAWSMIAEGLSDENSHIRHLSFREHHKVNENAMDSLKNIFNILTLEHNNIRSLQLGQMIFMKGGGIAPDLVVPELIEALVTAIEHPNCQLQFLDLSEWQMHADSTKKLATVFRKLKEISLSEAFPHHHTDGLTPALEEMHTSQITLTNWLTEEQWTLELYLSVHNEILKALENKQRPLLTLEVNDNAMWSRLNQCVPSLTHPDNQVLGLLLGNDLRDTTAGMKCLREKILPHPDCKIRRLEIGKLRRHPDFNEIMRDLIAIAENKQYRLEELDFSRCYQVSNEQLQQLFTALFDSTLKIVKARVTSMEQKTLDALAELLKTTKHLKELLIATGFFEECKNPSEVLAKALLDNQSLEAFSVDVEENFNIQTFAETLGKDEKNLSVKTLSFLHGRINEDGARALAKLIQGANNPLSCIKLSTYVKICDEGKRILAEAIVLAEKNGKIVRLDNYPLLNRLQQKKWITHNKALFDMPTRIGEARDKLRPLEEMSVEEQKQPLDLTMG